MFEYDKLNRLSKEQTSSKTTNYTYDNNGNILTKTTNGNVVQYTYNGEKLKSYNGQLCYYDILGNPILYRGTTCTWSRIKNLASYGDVQFTYNAQGLRLTKTANNTTKNYTWAGDKLVAETYQGTLQKTIQEVKGLDYLPQELPICTQAVVVDKTIMEDTPIEIVYLYGVNGITGFTLNGTEFYYRKNIQGDVTHIYDEFGKLMAHYVYNAWGEHQMLVDEDGIGKINAIRYRSYYYDNETGFYYLKSRYYDPEVGRFISMDSIEYLEPGRINGLNLYAYCLNNPIMYSDPDGNSVILAMLFGFLIGFGAGFGLNAVSQGLTNGWNNINLGQAAFNGLIGGISSALMLSPLGWGTVGLLGTGLGFTQSVGNDLFDNGGNWSKINWGKAAMFGIINGAFMGLGKWATSASVIGDIAKNSTRMQTQFMQTWYSRGMNFLTNSIIPSGFNYLFGFWEI